jgi:hypothetical protein
MKIYTPMIGTALLAFAVAAAAQTPTAEPAHQTMILTGCLTRVANASTLTLADARKLSPSPAKNSSGAASAVGTSGETADYEISADTRVDRTGVTTEGLLAHLDKMVEVTVRPVDDLAAAGPVSGPVTAEARPARGPRTEKVIAIDIKTVAATCGAKRN